jgi:hypothetical protein
VQNLGEVVTGKSDRSFSGECPSTENWICLECNASRCSRYVNGHSIHHAQSTGHCLAVSLSDLSVWCYECEAYVTHSSLKPILTRLEELKFSSEDATLSSQQISTKQILEQLAQMKPFLRPCSSSLPICLQETKNVCGTPTDFCLQRFSDQNVVLISQTGRIGTYIHCSLEDYGVIDGSAKTYHTVTLLGSRENALAEVCARQIHEQICQFELGLDFNRALLANVPVPPLLLGITLREKDPTRECMQELISSVINLYASSTNST